VNYRGATMNRHFLTFTAAAALAASGCVSSYDHCHARTVAVGWPTFQLANGTITSSCTGVSAIDVFMDDAQVGGTGNHFACADNGVNVTGVPNDGSHLFTVEALDSSGAIVLRDEQSVAPSGCTNLILDTRPSEGTFALNFSFTSANFCSSATNSYIWFTIHDDIANQTIAVDGSSTPQAWTCGSGTTTPVPISFPLASGSYTLQRTEEVVYPAPPVQAAGNCNATPFDVSGATQTQVNVPLTDAVACF
jgi:hypothetical protein